MISYQQAQKGLAFGHRFNNTNAGTHCGLGLAITAHRLHRRADNPPHFLLNPEVGFNGQLLPIANSG